MKQYVFRITAGVNKGVEVVNFQGHGLWRWISLPVKPGNSTFPGVSCGCQCLQVPNVSLDGAGRSLSLRRCFAVGARFEWIYVDLFRVARRPLVRWRQGRWGRFAQAEGVMSTGTCLPTKRLQACKGQDKLITVQVHVRTTTTTTQTFALEGDRVVLLFRELWWLP